MASNREEGKLNYETEWSKISASINQILYAFETGNSIVNSEWMALYNLIYNVATSQKEEKLYLNLVSIFENFARSQKQRIIDRGAQGEFLTLIEYVKLFNNFTKTAFSISRLSNYLHRYWIPTKMGSEVSGVPVQKVYLMALSIWKKHCFLECQDKLVFSAIDLINQDRDGKKQDKTLMRNFINSYVEFDQFGQNQGQQMYESEFEIHYISVLKDYYTKKSEQFLQKNDICSYLVMVEKWLELEKGNCEYLGTNYGRTTEAKIKEPLDVILISHPKESINLEFPRILKEDKLDDLKRLYNLLIRLKDGLNGLPDMFQEYLMEVGQAILYEQKSRDDDKSALQNSIPFIERLLSFYQKYSKILRDLLSNDKNFRLSFDKAFRIIFNQECGKFNIPRILNFYIDNIIRGKLKNNAMEDEMEEELQDLVNIFTYLQDKDEFIEYYRKQLCKRLLSKGKQYNENAEKNLLSKLKIQTGESIIRNLQGMFTDAEGESLSRMKKSFEEFNQGSQVNGVELEVQVLNECHWPISGSHKFPVYLSVQLLACKTRFEDFYKKFGENKRLQWLYNYGTVTLNSRFSNVKSYAQLIVTPLQACILLCFNENTSLSFEELLNHLWPSQISSNGFSFLTSSQSGIRDLSLEDILRFAIYPLIYFKFKVLQKVKKQESDSDNESINRDDIFTVLTKLPGQRPPKKIQFPSGSAKQQQREAEEDRALVIKQREFEVEAAMVRIMKSKGGTPYDWNQLQSEVVKQLKVRFVPDTKMMKKRLESLIDRGFMKREDNDIRKIVYTA